LTYIRAIILKKNGKKRLLNSVTLEFCKNDFTVPRLY